MHLYQNALDDLASQMATIHKSFISAESPKQLNISGHLIKALHTEMRDHVARSFPGLETLFHAIQQHVEQMVYTDVYPRFVRYQLALSASRALVADRFKYQGLGDCFCLTTPACVALPPERARARERESESLTSSAAANPTTRSSTRPTDSST